MEMVTNKPDTLHSGISFNGCLFHLVSHKTLMPRFPMAMYSRGSRKARKSSSKQSRTMAGEEKVQSKGMADLGSLGSRHKKRPGLQKEGTNQVLHLSRGTQSSATPSKRKKNESHVVHLHCTNTYDTESQ